MPFTVNKNLSVPTAGSLTGTWGTGSSESINEGVTELVDRMLGGLLNKSMAAGDVTLTGTEPQNAIIRLTGVLPASRVLTNSNVGFYFVENLTTGSFTVTVTNGVAGVVVPQGARSIIIADATNGCRLWGGTNPYNFVASTTKTVFVNATVPTTFALDTSTNNGTLRLVSSTGGGWGGTADFTTAFGARTILQANLPNYTLPNSLSLTNATNQLRNTDTATAGTDNFVVTNLRRNGSEVTIGITGSITSGGSGTAMDFAVKYRDAIIGTYTG